MHDTFNQSVILSIDEAMIAFKDTGTSAIKQYTPKKPTKCGARSGYDQKAQMVFICQFSIYTGKDCNIAEIGNMVKKLKYSTICLQLSIRPTNTGRVWQKFIISQCSKCSALVHRTVLLSVN